MQKTFFRKVLPAVALREYIREYTFIDIPSAQAKDIEFKVLPSSHARMVIFLSEPSLQDFKSTLAPIDRYSLTGFLSRPQVFVPTGNLQQVMVHFTAWGIQPFLDFPLSEITDARADLQHVFRLESDALVAELPGAGTLHERRQILDGFFMQRLRHARRIDERAKLITQYIMRIHGTIRLQQLSRSLFIGERTAQRLICNATGVGYKLFARVVRFEHVRRLMSQENITLTDVAHQAGYFDQAHFIHDFWDMSNENPGDYLKREQKLIWNMISAV